MTDPFPFATAVTPPGASCAESNEPIVPASGWRLSLFWLGLIAAAGLYGVVSISPKFVVYLETRDRFRNRQQDLVALEAEVQHLRRMVHVMETEPEVTRQLARIDFDLSNGESERIPVSEPLALTVSMAGPPPSVNESKFSAKSKSVPSRWRSLITTAAIDADLRRRLLAGSAILVLALFTLLPPTMMSRAKTKSSREPGWFARRYLTPRKSR